MILGRLAVAMGDEAANCLVLPAARIAKFFVWSDVVTFLVQAAGGGLSSAGSESMSKLGSRVHLPASPPRGDLRLTRHSSTDQYRRSRDSARIFRLLHHHFGHLWLPSLPSPYLLPRGHAVPQVRSRFLAEGPRRPRLAPSFLDSARHDRRHPRPIRVPSHRVRGRVLRVSRHPRRVSRPPSWRISFSRSAELIRIHAPADTSTSSTHFPSGSR